MNPSKINPLCAPTLLVLALLLTGCASKPQQPPSASPCPKLPPPPSLNLPLPPASYSLTVQENIKSWEKRLTGTSLTSEP